MKLRNVVALILFALLWAGSSFSSAQEAPAPGCLTEGVFTLYRSSPMDAVERIHVGTFDADEGPAVNRDNCSVAATLFQEQAGVSVRYWCEAGRPSE